MFFKNSIIENKSSTSVLWTDPSSVVEYSAPLEPISTSLYNEGMMSTSVFGVLGTSTSFLILPDASKTAETSLRSLLPSETWFSNFDVTETTHRSFQNSETSLGFSPVYTSSLALATTTEGHELHTVPIETTGNRQTQCPCICSIEKPPSTRKEVRSFGFFF